MKNEILFIVGPDGVGKTTQIECLIENFKKKGIQCGYQWLRFYHFFSLPILIIARLMNLSEIKTLKSGRKIGYHYFYKSRLICYLYSISLLLDSVFFTTFKVYIPIKLFKRNIVYDRFIYDTLVDLMVSTGDYEIYKSDLGKIFIRLIPKNSKIVMLIAETEILRKRRDDVKFDRTLDLKINLYKKIADKFKVPVIDANLPIEKVQEEIIKKIS